jgi:hypothetical protein
MSNILERVNPAAVGLSGNAILKYIQNLQACGTEMHALMIARHGRICAEGWWKPYSPGVIHGLQSLTKSYVATALGILVLEGRASISEKVVDILPEFMPANQSANLRALTIHDLLCMGAGNNAMQDRTQPTWLNDYFAQDFPYLPGSHFYYTGVGTSVLGAIIRKKTSLGLLDFLKPRLFNRIGIDAERLKWIQHPDGLEYGGGGLFATTEDNLRLGQLYLNGGSWQGQRIISEEWVKAATAKQINNDEERLADNRMGYGYQMWLCRPAGVYRFDGAKGQFVIVVPDLDLVISINQWAEGRLSQETLNLTWQYLAEAQGSDSGDLQLSTWLPRLSLPRTEYNHLQPQDRFTSQKTFRFAPNDIDLFPGDYQMLSYKAPLGIEQITFSEKREEILADIRCQNYLFNIHFSLDGLDRLSLLPAADDLPELVYTSAVWTDEDTLKLSLRFLETCFAVSYIIKRAGHGIELTAERRRPELGANGTQLVTIRSI